MTAIILSILAIFTNLEFTNSASASGMMTIFRGHGSNRCLGVPYSDSETANGTRVEIWDRFVEKNQQWWLDSDGTIRVMGDKYLEVASSGTANGTPVQVWSCHGGPNQKWTLRPDGTIQGYGNNCLEVTNSGTANGTPVQMGSCHGGPNQKWGRI
ncbi:RICIN domain-containing protein [Sorangium sp. So ce394]|uniref:RICIN domain-containing protein n=1 Tax=Sorangium sp. So ce394 TaxID=3133310 RepID=UPI003F5C646A